MLAGTQLTQRYELGCATLPVPTLVVFFSLPVAALFLSRLLAGLTTLLLPAGPALPPLARLSRLALLAGSWLALLAIPFHIVCHNLVLLLLCAHAHAAISRNCFLLVALAWFEVGMNGTRNNRRWVRAWSRWESPVPLATPNSSSALVGPGS
jgi:hypothetical protein